MEKLLERELARATALVEACEANNTPLGVVFQHRYRAGAEKLAQVMSSGASGKLLMARVTMPWWRGQSYCNVPGRGSYDVDGVGVLINQTNHVLDLMLSVTGPVSEVTAMKGTTPLKQMEADDFATAGLCFANGAIGSIVTTTAGYPGGTETLLLDCEHVALRLAGGS